MPSTASGGWSSRAGTASAAVRHVGVAEDGEGRGRRLLDQPDGGAEDHAAGALGTDQRLRQVAAALGQQVLEGVAGHLPPEAAELGADRAAMPGENRLHRRCGRARTGQQTLPGAVDDVQLHHVVRSSAVGQRVRTAGVVTDHAADGAAGVRGRVRPEAQPVRRGRPLQGVQHDPRLHDGGPGLGIEVQEPVEMPAEVEYHPGADRVARDGGARAAHGQRHAVGPAHVQGGRDLLDGVREGDHRRHHPVVRCVGGVLRAAAAIGVDGLHAGGP